MMGNKFPIQQINDNDFNTYFYSNIGDTILFSLDLSEQSLNEKDTFLIIKGLIEPMEIFMVIIN